MKKVVIAAMVAAVTLVAILASCTTVMMPVQINEGRATNVGEVVRSDRHPTQETRQEGVEQTQGERDRRDPIGVLGRADGRARLLAEFTDAAHIAGLASERNYDALNAGMR
ncbi:hypothetical protein [Pandoraea apista]|uniref:hypothetical protein n=1 Tax=Pandoraea apista TaxID=93218 RepID=UPI000F6793C6|nr:hypothetical protein [Pandoraea apista]RRW86928.1 hypothetical protein EGJ54_25630 [Pandoraea apista]RRW95241.1 hypothetical protein EGJ56_25680 [Pandoraea apista]